LPPLISDFLNLQWQRRHSVNSDLGMFLDSAAFITADSEYKYLGRLYFVVTTFTGSPSNFLAVTTDVPMIFDAS
jgi:hypothetical protein